MFDRVFNMDNGFWRAMTKLGDVIILNLLFILFSIPIVTIGASATALYTVMLKLVKNEEAYILRGFWDAFKSNIKQSTILWVIVLFAGVFLGLDLYLSSRIENSVMNVLNYIFILFTFIYAMIASYIFPLQAKFVNTIRKTIKNALLISIAHFPWTLLLVAINAIPLILLMINLGFLFLLLPCMLFFGFALLAFFNSFILNRVFKKYIPSEEDEETIPEALSEETP